MSTTRNVSEQGWALLRDNPFSEARIQAHQKCQEYLIRKRQHMLDRTRLLDQRQVEELERSSREDEDTGLLNKRTFEGKLQYEVKRAKRYRRPVALLLFSLDNLEGAVNAFSEMILDELFLKFAERLKENTRDSDILGRLGTNLFGVVCPESDIERALIIGRRVGMGLRSDALLPRSCDTVVTVSIGVAACPEDVKDPELLFGKCFEHLAMAKDSGGNSVFFTANVESMQEIPIQKAPDVTQNYFYDTDSGQWYLAAS